MIDGISLRISQLLPKISIALTKPAKEGSTEEEFTKKLKSALEYMKYKPLEDKQLKLMSDFVKTN